MKREWPEAFKMTQEGHEKLKEELKEREISERELREHEPSVGDRAFRVFLIGITVFLLIGLVVGAELALDHCGCSWSSLLNIN